MPRTPSNVYQAYGFLIGMLVDSLIHTTGSISNFIVLALFITPTVAIIVSMHMIGRWREKILGRKLNLKTKEKDFQEIDQLSKDNKTNQSTLRLVYLGIKLMMLSSGFLFSNIAYLFIFHKGN